MTRRSSRQASFAPANDTALLFGRHPVAAALRNPDRRLLAIWATDTARTALEALIGRHRRNAPPVRAVTRAQLDAMVPPGAVHQGWAVKAAPLPRLKIEDAIERSGRAERAVIVILDQVTDPHNVGAILRSAAAFGAPCVILQDRHSPPDSGTLAKSASGALETVALVRVPNLAQAMKRLKDAGFWLAGLDGAADATLAGAGLSGRVGLVMGAEDKGLRRLTRTACDVIVKLPTTGAVESLNVSNAAAIALYELFRTARDPGGAR